jgi:thiamine-monophosphate kinase
MIDLSDGLAGDAGHLAAASSVALEIDLDALPIAPEVVPEAGHQGVSPQQFAAEGGEDFELLVALPPRFNAAELFAQECGIPLTHIGTVGEGRGARFLLNGQPLTLSGFNHFG